MHRAIENVLYLAAQISSVSMVYAHLVFLYHVFKCSQLILAFCLPLCCPIVGVPT